MQTQGRRRQTPGTGKTRARVGVIRTRPETVLDDTARMMRGLDYTRALARDRRTILKDNISWHLPFLSANTTPWQLEGVVRTLREDGFRDLVGLHNQTVVTDAARGDRLNKFTGVYKRYEVPSVNNFSPDCRWVRIEPKAKLLVLDRIFGEVKVPAGALYGAQTQRAVENFPISGLKPWRAFIWSMAAIKRAAADVNAGLGLLDGDKANAIAKAAAAFGAMPQWVVRELGMPRRDAMTQRLREALGPETEWTLDVRYGSPHREIAAAAGEIDGTLIVVDASPHRRVRRSVAGVRALQVVRHATCPVLSVAPGGDELPRRIVASVDFSPASTRAVQTALLLAGDATMLSLAHVPFPFRLERPVYDAAGGLIGGDVGAAFEQLLDAVRPLAPRDLTIETTELSGKIADAVLSHAEGLHADLLATGAHGPTVVERFFVGSVATNLIHLAECSVLAAPAPTH